VPDCKTVKVNRMTKRERVPLRFIRLAPYG
jgi:hypothetical protein